MPFALSLIEGEGRQQQSNAMNKDHLPRNAMPLTAGIGLRAGHYQTVLETVPRLGWVEVHSENYFGEGGRPLHVLQQVRDRYPLSLHGVGLSLGSADPLNRIHLNKLKGLIDRFDPRLVSEHLCWSSINGHYFNDLLPLPYTEEALAHMSARIREVQDFLKRPILIENLSSYLEFEDSSIPEAEFIAELARTTGCGILLDVNNVYVAAVNHGFDARQFIQQIPGDWVQEIHLAGFTRKSFEDGEILIDTHNQRVAEAVWRLYAYTLEIMGAKPTLIEWDSDLPPLETLLEEANIADRMLHTHGGGAYDRAA
jgi:hypothetical protein